MKIVDDVDTQIEESERAIAALDSTVPHRKVSFNWRNSAGEFEDYVYIQEELGFFGVQQFVTLTTKRLKELKDAGELRIGEMFGGNADSMRARLQMPGEFTPEQLESTLNQNEGLINGFLELVQMLPEYQKQIICLSLGAPAHTHDFVKAQLSEPQSRGGLSVKEGYDLMTTFVIQNAGVIRDFFAEEGKTFVATVQQHVLGVAPEETVAGTATEMPTDSPSSPGGTLSSTSSQGTPGSPSTES